MLFNKDVIIIIIMFDQAHLTAVLGIESSVDLDWKARSTLNNSYNFFARRLLSFYDMLMLTVSIIFELIQCILWLKTYHFRPPSLVKQLNSCTAVNATLCKIYWTGYWTASSLCVFGHGEQSELKRGVNFIFSCTVQSTQSQEKNSTIKSNIIMSI